MIPHAFLYCQFFSCILAEGLPRLPEHFVLLLCFTVLHNGLNPMGSFRPIVEVGS